MATEIQERKQRFPLGRCYATPGVMMLFTGGRLPLEYFARHQSGDWGAVDDHDAEANEYAVENGLRIVSVYPVRGVKCYVITEADRSSTTLLTAAEY